jgi:hypothetical protein
MNMDGSKFMEMCFGLRFTLSYSPVWLGVAISWLSWLLAVSSVNSWDIFIHSKSKCSIHIYYMYLPRFHSAVFVLGGGGGHGNSKLCIYTYTPPPPILEGLGGGGGREYFIFLLYSVRVIMRARSYCPLLT